VTSEEASKFSKALAEFELPDTDTMVKAFVAFLQR
jgi:hypothetical protein